MKATYEAAMDKVFEDEGGYDNDPHDPGGPTKYGITIYDVRKYLNPHATASDVKHLTKAQARTIYDLHYALPVRYDDLPPGVDYAVLDYGINSGISRSAKVLQKFVGVRADGKIGPLTLAAVRTVDAKDLIIKIQDERLAFLKSLRTWKRFGKGWTRRVLSGTDLAMELNDKYGVIYV